MAGQLNHVQNDWTNSDFFTEDETKGYRKGFDQGVAALAYALGIPNDQLQRTAFKQRVKQFRWGRTEKADSLWETTPAESKELASLVGRKFRWDAPLQ